MTKKNHSILLFSFSLLILTGLVLLFKSGTVNATNHLTILTHTPPVLSQTELNIATTKAECDSLVGKICFFNQDGIDDIYGRGTGLRSAIEHAKTEGLSNVQINVHGNYLIKANTVLIDYPVVIQGIAQSSISTDNPNCESPMLRIEEAVTIKDLAINDGIEICKNLSRDLIVVNSPNEVLIRNTTLSQGKNAITYQANSGNLKVLFNNIHSNSQYAILGNIVSNSGRLKVIGNRIVDNNNNSIQVDCGNKAKSNVDHNYWGLNRLPSNETVSCNTIDSKRLGTEPKVLDNGISGDYIDLTSSYSSPVLGSVSAKANDSGDRLFVIDHDNAIPFQDNMHQSYELTSCGSFYDVFMDENASSDEVYLQFSYKGSPCQSVIESQYVCGSNDISKFPLMWHDPAYDITDNYDNVGSAPEGSSQFIGQETRCDTSNKTIEVKLNRSFSNRPNLDFDLNYTPFTIGFEKAVIKSFETSNINSSSITLNWKTFSEANAEYFKIFRSKGSEENYIPLNVKILRKGTANTGESYSFTDSGLEHDTNYRYKLFVYNSENIIQQEIGPIDAKTLADDSTPTTTPTKTNTLSPSNTPYPISYTPTQTSYSYRTHTPTKTLGSIRTSTPLPELTQIVKNQTMTAFFFTQTVRYASKEADDTNNSIDTTPPPFTDDKNTVTPTLEQTDEALSESTYLPEPTAQVIKTDKTDRYQEKDPVSWPIWLILIPFIGLAVFLYTRNKIVS